MADEYKNVRRIQTVDRTSIINQLKTKMLGFVSTDAHLAFKSSGGTTYFFPSEGSSASFDSLKLTGFGGEIGILAVDSQGNIVTTSVDSGYGSSMSTGVVAFGGLTINTDNTKFNVGAVKAYYVDNTDPSTPLVTYKEFSAQTAIVTTNILTHVATYVGINVSGTIVQSTTEFTPSQKRSIIPLGVIVHSNKTIINAVNNLPHTTLNPTNQLEDLMESMGDFVVTGNQITANGTGLRINKSGGNIFKHGSNFVADSTNPHILTLIGLTAPDNMRYRTQDSDEDGDTQVIDPSRYDLNGVKTTIPGSGWTVQRVFLFSSNLLRIQYGQQIYASKADALNGIGRDTFITEPNISANGIHIAYLVLDKTCNLLTDTAKCEIIQVGKFGTIIGSASASVDTLQSAYDNSSEPEITTNGTLGAVTIKNGQSLDTANQLEIKNIAGVVTAYIKGDGTNNLYTHPSTHPWSMIDGRPTTLAGYGITDATPSSHIGSTGSAHGNATGSVAGFMSSSDYTKLSGLSNYTLPTATASILGGIKIGTGLSINGSGVVSTSTTLQQAYNNSSFPHITLTDAVNYIAIDRGVSTLDTLMAISGNDTIYSSFNTTGIDIFRTLRYTKGTYRFVNEYHGNETCFYSYNESTRVYTFNSGGTSVYWLDGIRYNAPNNLTVTHGSVHTIYYIYINASNNLVADTTVWDLKTDVPLLAVYWDAVNAQGIPIYECHNKTRDLDWHGNAHTTLGTQAQIDGFSLIGINEGVTAPTLAQLRYGIATGWLKDEDIKIGLDQLSNQGTSYPIIFRQTSGNPDVSINSANTVPFYYDGVSSYIKYDTPSGGGTFSIADQGKWVNYFMVAVPTKTSNSTGAIVTTTNHKYRFIWIAGQAQHSTIDSARAEEFSSLNIGDFNNFSEWVPLYRITYKTSASLTTVGKCYVQETKRYYMSRSSITGTASTVVSHNSLTGRDTADAHPHTAISVTGENRVLFVDNGALSTHAKFLFDPITEILSIGTTGGDILNITKNSIETPSTNSNSLYIKAARTIVLNMDSDNNPVEECGLIFRTGQEPTHYTDLYKLGNSVTIGAVTKFESTILGMNRATGQYNYFPRFLEATTSNPADPYTTKGARQGDFWYDSTNSCVTLMLDNSNNRVYLSTIPDTGKPVLTKTIIIESPVSGDSFTIFKVDTPANVTVQEVLGVITGAGTSVAYTLYRGAERNAGTSWATSTASSKTSGTVASISGLTLFADNWIWIDIGTVTGTITSIAVDIRYTEN